MSAGNVARPAAARAYIAVTPRVSGTPRVFQANHGGFGQTTSGPRRIELCTSGSSSGSCTIPRPLPGSSSVPPGKPPQGIDAMA